MNLETEQKGIGWTRGRRRLGGQSLSSGECKRFTMAAHWSEKKLGTVACAVVSTAQEVEQGKSLKLKKLGSALEIH